MIEICPECETEMIEERKDHFKCPNCNFTRWVIPMSKSELKALARTAYMDGRHWNHGGGLNK